MNDRRYVGAVIEGLISIKDSYKDELCADELEAINDACNILSHRFNRFDVPEVIIHDHITSVSTSRSEVGDKLHEAGYLGNDDNINILRQNGLEKALQERMTERMWEVIDDLIAMNRERLEKR